MLTMLFGEYLVPNANVCKLICTIAAPTVNADIGKAISKQYADWIQKFSWFHG